MPITWTPKDQMQAAKAADARGWWVQFLLCPGWRKRVRIAFASEFGYGELVLGFGFCRFCRFCLVPMRWFDVDATHFWDLVYCDTHTHSLIASCHIVLYYYCIV